MGLKAGWLALFAFVWVIGAFLGSTFDYQSTASAVGMSYSDGTITITNGSITVTGAGTAWIEAMEDGNIQADDGDEIWAKILSIDTPTQLTLYSPYSGTGGVGLDYEMRPTPGWAGTGGGGYAVSPTTKLQYLTNISNAFQRLSLLGNIPLPVPNPKYFTTLFEVVTWQWSFFDGYDMFYWIFCAPFIMMGILSMILLVYGLITGNISW